MQRFKEGAEPKPVEFAPADSTEARQELLAKLRSEILRPATKPAAETAATPPTGEAETPSGSPEDRVLTMPEALGQQAAAASYEMLRRSGQVSADQLEAALQSFFVQRQRNQTETK